MKRTVLILTAITTIATLTAACASTSANVDKRADSVPLKEAKLNIEHNATDGDTGFQGALDSEGWKSMEVKGPGGKILSLKGQGELGELGLTELFFESVEPANADIPIEEVLGTLPEGDYSFSGDGIESGEKTGNTSGTAWLTHDIPAGPVLLSPAEGSTIPTTGQTANWQAVTETIDGDPVSIIAYQIIIEKVGDPHQHMIGKMGLSIYLPAATTSIAIPDGFLEAGTDYAWEVLAIEESGNQTLSSGTFSTQ
jgi:hypothetical protein